MPSNYEIAEIATNLCRRLCLVIEQIRPFYEANPEMYREPSYGLLYHCHTNIEKLNNMLREHVAFGLFELQTQEEYHCQTPVQYNAFFLTFISIVISEYPLVHNIPMKSMQTQVAEYARKTKGLSASDVRMYDAKAKATLQPSGSHVCIFVNKKLADDKNTLRDSTGRKFLATKEQVVTFHGILVYLYTGMQLLNEFMANFNATSATKTCVSANYCVCKRKMCKRAYMISFHVCWYHCFVYSIMKNTLRCVVIESCVSLRHICVAYRSTRRNYCRLLQVSWRHCIKLCRENLLQTDFIAYCPEFSDLRKNDHQTEPPCFRHMDLHHVFR